MGEGSGGGGGIRTEIPFETSDEGRSRIFGEGMDEPRKGFDECSCRRMPEIDQTLMKNEESLVRMDDRLNQIRSIEMSETMRIIVDRLVRLLFRPNGHQMFE